MGTSESYELWQTLNSHCNPIMDYLESEDLITDDDIVAEKVLIQSGGCIVSVINTIV